MTRRHLQHHRLTPSKVPASASSISPSTREIGDVFGLAFVHIENGQGAVENVAPLVRLLRMVKSSRVEPKIMGGSPRIWCRSRRSRQATWIGVK